jgi:hypothetical protein
VSKLGEGGTLGHATNLLEEIVREREPLESRTGLELPMELIGDMAQLDHLRHAITMSA